jgi:gluconokinase
VEHTTTIVVMGVAGSGKSTVMHALVGRLGWASAEGDSFHSPANVARMTAGQPLTDEDRWPWLAALGDWISRQEARGSNAIVTCSALRRVYRDRLRQGRPSVWFVHLVAPHQVLAERIEDRTGHYMPASLLPSQLETLEPLAPDEPGAVIDASGDLEGTVAAVLTALPRDRGAPAAGN